MPPLGKPFPRFIADFPREKAPYGRWEERLAAEFTKACEPHVEEAGAGVDPQTIKWFPERTYGGRTYIPVTAAAAKSDSAEGAPIEYFGHVSFVRPENDGEPSELRAQADFTDVTAEDNPDWRVDLNDDVVGKWRAGGDRVGDITLIWGLPLVGGAVAATAELDGEVVDQAAVEDGRFTLVAVDAVQGFGDRHLYLDIVLWDRTLRRVVASESLYAEADEDQDGEGAEDGEGDESNKPAEKPAGAQ
jgi:hypothetical protein